MAIKPGSNPNLKKALNSDNRLLLINHAIRNMRSVKLEEKRVKAREAFRVSFLADAKAIPKKEIEILEKYGKVTRLRSVKLPSSLTLPGRRARDYERRK